jgi:hypothetical protein
MSHESDITKIEDIDNAGTYKIEADFDIAIIPQDYPDSETPVLMPDAGDFAKWLKRTHPKINLYYGNPQTRIVLRAADYWLPFVVLANEVTLPVFLNLVSSYVYDRMKGALRGDSTNVHIEAVFTDTNNGVYKRFKYDGDVAGIEKIMKKVDINKLMEHGDV